jgi:hypothetical protein
MNSGWIDLIISPLDNKGQRLSASFHFYYLQEEGKPLEQVFHVTPSIVKQVIEYGLKNSWQSNKTGKEFTAAYMDDRIHIGLADITGIRKFFS